MPYKIIDTSIGHYPTEILFNDMELAGFDLILWNDRFAIFHKPLEKPKKPRVSKEPKNGTPTTGREAPPAGNPGTT